MWSVLVVVGVSCGLFLYDLLLWSVFDVICVSSGLVLLDLC